MSPAGGSHDFGSGIRSICETTPSNNVIIEHCASYGNGVDTSSTASGPGIWLDHAGTGNIVRYNISYGNESGGSSAGIGIYLEALGTSSAVKAYYNISYGNEIGIMLSRETHDCEIYNNVSYNNTVANFNVLGSWGGGDAQGMEDNVIKNNISLPGPNAASAFGALYGGDNDGVDGDRNIYLNNCWGAEGAGFIVWGFGVTKAMYDDWETAYGATTSSVEADPLMTDPASDDFTLQPGSPCRERGAVTGLTADYNGDLVPQGVTDIGAYEYAPQSGALFFGCNF